MKVKVNATIVMDIEALKADKNLEHFADYAISHRHNAHGSAPRISAHQKSFSRQVQ